MQIPVDVKAWIRGVFRACNDRTSDALMNMPNTHEGALDLAFISEAARFSAPVRFPSDWIVRIDTHFLGGRRHFRNWEIADIGVLIVFRRGGKLLKSKIALLQSKRLYPAEHDYEEDEQEDYEIGFARLFRGDARFESITEPRVFAFVDGSRYQALKVGDGQYQAVREYESTHAIPVYYLLYHPGRMPYETRIPRVGSPNGEGATEIGARVLPAESIRQALSAQSNGYSPHYSDLKDLCPEPSGPSRSPPGWRIEEFIADLALDCKVGHVARKESDRGLSMVFNRRSGPISAAIAITFDAPPGAGGD